MAERTDEMELSDVTAGVERADGSANRHRSAEDRSAPRLATLRRFARHRLAVVSLLFVMLVVAAALLGPELLNYRYDAQNLSVANLAPTTRGFHLFGTDQLGRDYLVRVLVGTRTSLATASIAAAVSTIVGTAVGLCAGYYRRVENLLMRVTDLFILLPGLAVLLILVQFLSHGSALRKGVILGLLMWPLMARVIRAVTLSLKELGYVEAAKACGVSDARIIARHLLPNSIGPLAVNATLTVANAILVEATLAFLGVGVQPPHPALGELISDGQGSMFSQWWLVVIPGLLIMFTCLAINFIGDGLRDAIH